VDNSAAHLRRTIRLLVVFAFLKVDHGFQVEKHSRYISLNSYHRMVLTILGAILCVTSPLCAQTPADHKTQHIIFVMTDGLRWQEVFSGAEESLMNKKNGRVANETLLKQTYWRETPEERREALLPFVWEVMAKQGQIFGNREKGSDAYVTNGLWFSYPGYNETLCGFADPRINSNDNVPNPNVTVLEWLRNRPSFQGDIAAFGAWDVIAAVFNPERSKLTVNAGYDPFTAIPATPQLELLNHLKAETPRVWEDEPFDAIPFYTAVEYLKAKKPRVLYLSLGETDDWAHEGKYKEYLDSAHRVDSYLQAFWELLQSMPEYRGNTTLIFSPDHGRGKAPHKWRDHGRRIPDSKYIWMAFLGPDTPALGERSKVAPVTQNQIAATLAVFLGEDYAAAVPKAGKPIADVLPH
jgi:Type I phosphodiesterase / nucleotide pyrophosphatase